MSRTDDLLWELPRVDEDRAGEPPSDAQLRAYRDGELDEAAATRLEWELARSRAARDRLFAAAGDEEIARVRGRLFGAARSSRGWWALAASLAGIVALGTAIWMMQADAPTTVAAIEVRMTGLAEVRSPDATSSAPVEAYPQTTVRVAAEVRGEARAGIDWALYRDDGAQLVRVDDAAGVRREVGRGAAAFEAPAEALVGERIGDHTLYIVAAESSRLPRAVAIDAGDEASDALARASRGRVVARTLRVIRGGS